MLKEASPDVEEQQVEGDLVAQVYHGEVGGNIQREKTRSRVDWMAGQMRGHSALDIGCSQGILGLLLGKGPVNVLGVDLNQSSVDYANAQLATESSEVKARIEYRQLNFIDEDLPESGFDTVFLGEVIEHLQFPAAFISKAVEKVADGGRLVITTPHGYLPHDDHYHAFGLGEFVDLLPDSISAVSLDASDGYIRFVGAKAVEGAAIRPSYAELEKIATDSMIEQQKFFHHLLARKNARLGHLERKLQGAEKREAGFTKHESEYKAAEADYQRTISELTFQLERQTQVVDDLRAKAEYIAALEKQIQTIAAVKDASITASDLRHEVALQRDKSKKLAARVNTLKSQLGDLEENRKQLLRGPTFRAGKIIVEAYEKPWPNALLIGYRLVSLARDPWGKKAAQNKKGGARVNALKAASAKAIEIPAAIRKTVTPNRQPPLVEDYPAYKPLKLDHTPNLPVAAIMDEFTAACFQYQWDLALITQKNWKQEIVAKRPAFLFVESAWRGNGGEWNYLLTKYKDKPDNALRDLLAYCRQESIPTVFWNKEDPPNFEVFRHAAVDFDYIFTTDEGCVQKYLEICSHDRVYALPFAAEPVLHNPASRQSDASRDVAFGGGWYAEKHTARQKYLPPLLDAVIEQGRRLTIFDRFSDLKDNEKHRFPEAYKPYLHEKIAYQQMLSAYRMFPVFLNVNSVTESGTMFSRRVFELLACGTSVVSSPSRGMQEMLGDVVGVAEDKQQAEILVEDLFEDAERRERAAHVGYRKVMTEHTYRHRAQTVEATVLAESSASLRVPMVSVVLPTNRPHFLQQAKESFERQLYPNKELILALNSDSFSREAVLEMFDGMSNVKIFHIPESKNLPTCLNHVLQYADGEYWAKFDDDDVYGPNYLSDSLLPFAYTDASIVGKATYFAQVEGDGALYIRHPGKQHRYAKLVCGGTIVARMDVMDSVSFDESKPRGSDTAFLRAALDAGKKIYSSDPYNFIQVRASDTGAHTWKVDTNEYLKKCHKVSPKFDSELVIF